MIKIFTYVGEHGECVDVWVEGLQSLMAMVEDVAF
jgi:hypothetical protein